MIRWLWRLIWGRPACEHKWEQVDEINVWDSYVSATIPVAYKYVLRCEKCGDIKSVRV